MKPETVHLFVFDTLSDWEPGYAVAGINNPAFQLNPGRYRIATVGRTTAPVRTMGGVAIVPDMAIESLQPGDSAMLILPGGETWDKGKNVEAIEKAKEFLAAGVPVAAICGATGALGRAGLLNERRHTSNFPDYLKSAQYTGAALYQNARAVCDGNVITAGGMSPIEFAYEIFKRLDVYRPKTLEAWFALFKSGDMASYFAMVKSVES
jgi:putative intracellular protease/amidase